MPIQFQFTTIVNGYNVYTVIEVDTNVYFCSPKHRPNDYWFNEHPEFYLSKVKNKWVHAKEMEHTYVHPHLLEEAIKEIEDYLFNLRFNKKGS